MSGDAMVAERSGDHGLELDPFAFFEGAASRIGGLGGTAASQDPPYVFHTLYVPAALGPIAFTVRFDGLRAKRGTLLLRVHMLPMEAGAHARLVNSERITINRLIAQGSETTIAAEGFRGMSYALYGSIADETDAVADGLTVTLDRPETGHSDGVAVIDARNTRFRTEALRPTAHLVSLERPLLAEPVSQICTVEQFREPVYAMWVDRIGAVPQVNREQWEQVYILQVLHRYGMLAAGARGIGLDVVQEPLPALMVAMGVELDVTGPIALGERGGDEASKATAGGIEAFHRPDLCDDAVLNRSLRFHPAEPGDLPAQLVNADFLWSRSFGRSTPPAEIARLVEASMDCIRPGGIAVHAIDFTFGTRARNGEGGFGQGELERLALVLISRGHEVAQVRLAPADQRVGRPLLEETSSQSPPTASIGLIVRKAPSQL